MPPPDMLLELGLQWRHDGRIGVGGGHRRL